MTIIIVVCVGFLVFMVVLGVIRVRAAHTRAAAHHLADTEMAWDDTSLNITVNPMEVSVSCLMPMIIKETLETMYSTVMSVYFIMYRKRRKKQILNISTVSISSSHVYVSPQQQLELTETQRLREDEDDDDDSSDDDDASNFNDEMEDSSDEEEGKPKELEWDDSNLKI